LHNRDFYNKIIFSVILLCALFLLFFNLGNQYLWQDEAETALVSKTILTDGIPRATDGTNSFSQLQGRDYGKNNIWIRHTWLPFYVLAGFYKIFGETTFISRLPFAIFGFGTIVLTYFFAKTVWGRRISLIVAALLVCCVPFLLLSRQCRYYSMVMFFSVLALYSYNLLMNRKKYSGLLLFVSIVMLFHSQHIYIVIIIPAIILHVIIFHRGRLKELIFVSAAACLVTIPFFVWLSSMNFTYAEGNRFINEIAIINAGSRMLIQNIISNVFPVWIMLAAIIVIYIKYIKIGRFSSNRFAIWENISLPIFFIVLNFAVITVFTPFPFFRYMAPSLPLFMIMAAVIIDGAWKTHKLFAIAAVIFLLSTSRMNDFIYEITHDFDGPIEGICKYLNEYGKPDDVVAITYGDMPVKFYTNLRVVGGHTGESLEPAKNARWVIFRKYFINENDYAVRQFLEQNINLKNYRRIQLSYPDTTWENREDITVHFFKTQTNEDKVVIYERAD